jgi:hypothetical protein
MKAMYPKMHKVILVPVVLACLVIPSRSYAKPYGSRPTPFTLPTAPAYADSSQAMAFLWERRGDYQTNAELKPQIASTIGYLGKIKAKNAAGLVATFLDLKYDRFEDLPFTSRFPAYTYYPAIPALVSIGDASVPYIIDELSSRSDSREITWSALTALRMILHDDKNVLLALMKYSQKYKQRAKRLEELSNEVLRAKFEVSKIDPLPEGIPESTLSSNLRLQRIFSLSDALRERLNAPSEKDSEAIRELAKLKASECGSDIAEFLSYNGNTNGGDKEENKYSDFPAVVALISIGSSALADVAQSMAQDGRSASFRRNGLYVMVRVAGDRGAASKVLLEQAARCRSQAERLRDLARRSLSAGVEKKE